MMAIRFFCDKCGEEKPDSGICHIQTKTKGDVMLCKTCEQDLELQINNAEKLWWKGEKVVFKEPDKVFDLQYVGFSNHDCESWYKCPECGEEYGSWGFMNKKLKAGEVFECEKCGAKLRVPK